MTSCPDCGSENREDARFCDGCGARLEREVGKTQPQVAPEDQGLALSLNEDEGAFDSTPSEDAGVPDASGEPESGLDVTETEGEAPAESPDLGDVPTGADDGSTGAEDDLPAEPSKSGYLVFPDQTEQPIPESQWLIGRADLAKFLPDPEQANEISRGHLTVFQEGERFFVEDGTTMVQRRPSTNKTWLVRGSSRILVTGTGRTELRDDDEIDVAELVKLQFVVR